MPGVAIMLLPAGTTSILSLSFANTVDQRRVFSFNAVADGEYDLLASFQPDENPLVGTECVRLRGGDVPGIELKLASLASITVRSRSIRSNPKTYAINVHLS